MTQFNIIQRTEHANRISVEIDWRLQVEIVRSEVGIEPRDSGRLVLCELPYFSSGVGRGNLSTGEYSPDLLS
jgi:hypothetical protein